MRLRPATDADLQVLIPWVPDADACRLWAGPVVRYPLSAETLAEDIQFSSENAFSMMDNRGNLAGLGQLIPKGRGRFHMARIIVAPGQRGRGLGRLLCRFLIDEGVRRLGATSFSLNVYPRNVSALGLYKSVGFHVSKAPPGAGEEYLPMVFTPVRGKEG